jgi:ABC-type nitrate/sulfonate/bicarbonate transport system ATPase subunit
MKQRVGIARALAAGPDMLLMDEPFGALDILTRDSMQKELLRICREVKPTVLFVTHSISEAVSIGDRVVVMKHGAIASVLDVGMKHPRSFQHNRFGQLMAEIEAILMEDQAAAAI